MATSILRERLNQLDSDLHDVFVEFSNSLTPLLESIEQLFPEFTRHDPSHNVKLEQIAADVLTRAVLNQLSAADVFSLLCALCLHDAGMGVDPEIEGQQKRSPQFREKLAIYERLGFSEQDCWRDFVRENHHTFCSDLSNRLLSGKVSDGFVHWIGEIAKSHGERNIHDTETWPKSIAVADNQHICPPLLAAIVRLSDILHFNYQRAPEYMQEHRKIQNSVSLQHWKAHQIASDYHIADDICFFDGVTKDDEAYWFSKQFTDAMDNEVKYCKELVLPFINDPLRKALSFSRVENRIVATDFVVERTPVTLRIETEKFLEDLLNDSLYANQPTWFREVVQNAFDACRDRQAIESHSHPELVIRLNTTERSIELEDSGVGMSLSTVENFLLVAGASFWSSREYRGRAEKKSGQVGKFGIGFMSTFGVAERILVDSRHVKSDEAFRFLIRTPRQTVRVEQAHRSDPGTTVKLYLKPDVLIGHDIVELFDQICPFPEYPVKLLVDNEIVREFSHGQVPSTVISGLELTPTGTRHADATLFKIDLEIPGIRGDFYFAKIFLKALDSRVPLHVRLMAASGWEFNHQSKTYFGGVSYPSVGSLDHREGFFHVPSIGCLRLAVSPNEFPLEMNLARERFITGDNTAKFFTAVCGLLDEVFTKDIEAELASKTDGLVRSSIAASYSDEMMEAWVGHVSDLSYVAAVLSVKAAPIEMTPWPQLTKLMMKELRFGCLDAQGRMALSSIDELVSQEATVVSIGADNQQVSPDLIESIDRYDRSARLLLVLPSRNFGIKLLRHWAGEEILIPVPVHNRCAFGLRFTKHARPFKLFPRELDYLTLPVASGPKEYALLDYRDFMAEASGRPSGSPGIIAVLNRRNEKAGAIIKGLQGLKGLDAAYSIKALNIKGIKDSLKLGTNNSYYKGNRGRLALELQRVVSVLGREGLLENTGISFCDADMPAYFDGGEVVPFGRFALNVAIVKAYQELFPLEQQWVTWS